MQQETAVISTFITVIFIVRIPIHRYSLQIDNSDQLGESGAFLCGADPYYRVILDGHPSKVVYMTNTSWGKPEGQEAEKNRWSAERRTGWAWLKCTGTQYSYISKWCWSPYAFSRLYSLSDFGYSPISLLFSTYPVDGRQRAIVILTYHIKQMHQENTVKLKFFKTENSADKLQHTEFSKTFPRLPTLLISLPVGFLSKRDGHCSVTVSSLLWCTRREKDRTQRCVMLKFDTRSGWGQHSSVMPHISVMWQIW